MLSDRSTLGSAYTGAASLAVVAREVPDAMLLDIDPPDLDGIEVLRRIVCRPPGATCCDSYWIINPT